MVEDPRASVLDGEPDITVYAVKFLKFVGRRMSPWIDRLVIQPWKDWVEESRKRAENDPLLHPSPPSFIPPRRATSGIIRFTMDEKTQTLV